MKSLFRACSTALLCRQILPTHNLTKPISKLTPFKPIIFHFNLTVCCCYSSSVNKTKKKPRDDIMNKEKEKEKSINNKDEFFVVRKGDLIGVYKTLTDCQAQVGSSICDPPVSVYKGHTMPKNTEEYLLSCGLKNALYSIRADDLKDDLFGLLVPCPFQLPSPKPSEMDVSKKRSFGAMGETMDMGLSTSISTDPMKKHVNKNLCILEFDGASKGNPGRAGAGAVLRADDGTVICRLREGLGTATNNVAEYRAMILGLRYALDKGFENIRVFGDSKLVCMQTQGLWKVKDQNMSNLHKEAKILMDKFLSFEIKHVLRGSNADADAEANLGATLADGQIQEDFS